MMALRVAPEPTVIKRPATDMSPAAVALPTGVAFRRTSPSLMVRLPAKVLAAVSVRMPVPDLVRPAEPLMTPESVWLALPVSESAPEPLLAMVPE